MFWTAPLWNLRTHFWSNALIFIYNSVFSGRIRSSVLPQSLCSICHLAHNSAFIFSIISGAIHLNRRLYQIFFFFLRNTYKYKNNTVKNFFLYILFGFCIIKKKKKKDFLEICLSKSIFSLPCEMTGYIKCPNINFCGMSVYSSVNLQWIFWFSISLSQTTGKLNFSNRHQFSALNACSALQDILIIFFSAKWQIPFSWQ